MATKKVTALTELASPTDDDILYIVEDPGGTPLSRKITWANLKADISSGATDHGALTGLTDDDHSIYALLAGRSGGQTPIGGTGVGDGLSLQSTSGVGTSDFIRFLVGNNGGTEALRAASNGKLANNGETAPDAMLELQAAASTDVVAHFKGASGQSADAIQVTNSSDTAYFTVGPPTLAADGSNQFLNITGTLNSSPSAALSGVDFNITSAGTHSKLSYGARLYLLAGYTGSSSTIGCEIQNKALGTASTYVSDTSSISYRPGGNYGFNGLVFGGTTTGNRMGGVSLAAGGNVNYGSWSAATVTKNGATNVGVLGAGLNGGTTPTQVGGAFFLLNSASAPPLTSAALLADNGIQTDPIFVARDNGSTVFAIVDGGFVERKTTAGITASTTQTQGQGALTADWNEVSICANANDTVTLPPAAAGRQVWIRNNGAQTLQIFPASGDDLGAGVDTATTLAAGSAVVYRAYDATNWR